MNTEEKMEAAIELFSQGQPAEALKIFSEIVAEDETNAQAAYFQGCALADAGDHENAVVAYEKSAKHAGERAALPLYHLGNSYQALGDLPKAALSFNAALEADPTMADAWINLGRVLDDMGNSETAVQCYDAALQIDPNDTVAHANRGNSLRQLDRFDEALQCFTLALECENPELPAYLGQAICFVHTGEKEKGFDALDKIYEATQNATVLFEKGVLLGLQDDNEEALAAFDQVLAENYHSPQLFNNRAEVLAKLTRVDEALESFDQSLELENNFYPALFGKCRLLSKLDRIDEARATCERLLEICSDEQKERPEIAALAQRCGLT